MAALDSGGFVVTWTNCGQDGSDCVIRGMMTVSFRLDQYGMSAKVRPENNAVNKSFNV